MAHLQTYTKPQKLSSEAPNFPLPPKATKFYSHFLYKALLATVFLLIIQNFPAEAPEFMNQTVLPGSWELLHLLFVGVAVCYGLFSKRNDDEPEKESNSKIENAQSYVSRFLQVNSFFDDEVETSSGSDENSVSSSSHNKVQTWNSQYFRGEPPVVVTQESSDENRGFSSRIMDKPLLLPVRSLKSHVLDSGNGEYGQVEGSNRGSASFNRLNSSSKRFSRSSSGKSRSVELQENPDLEEREEENVVLPSPIPWRSRSGRMELKQELDGPGPNALPTSIEELGSRSFKSQSSVGSPRSSSMSSSPKNLSPSPSISMESQAKNAEDLVRRKSFNKASHPPPAPPLPPPPMYHRSHLTNSSSSRTPTKTSSEKEYRRGTSIEPKNLNRTEREDILRRVNSNVEAKSKAQIDDSFVKKSVRTSRASEFLVRTRTVREVENGKDVKQENAWNDFRTSGMEDTRRKSLSFDERLNRESFDCQKEDEKLFEDIVTVETDYDSESEAESNDVVIEPPVSDVGPDVDRKADEFIAKFREQIRLQRIESIKRSSRQINRNFSR